MSLMGLRFIILDIVVPHLPQIISVEGIGHHNKILELKRSQKHRCQKALTKNGKNINSIPLFFLFTKLDNHI